MSQPQPSGEPGTGQEAPEGAAQLPPLSPQDAALIAETCVRSDILWIRARGESRHQAAWHVWYDDAVCVLVGVGEQMLPLLDGLVEVIARSKDTGARGVRFVAETEQLPATDPAWEGAATLLAGKRLNADDQAGQRERWARGGIITLLRPVSLLAAGGDDDNPAGAAPPPGGPATTLGRTPFHLGGRRRRARRRQQTAPDDGRA